MTYAKLRDFPPAAIRPEGWLRHYLQIQREGLTWHLEVAGYPLDGDGWASTGIAGRQGDAWWPYEQTGYWIDGMLRCGHLLGDRFLIDKARRHVEFVLEHAENHDVCNVESMLWAYERTGDQRLLDTAVAAYEGYHRAQPDTPRALKQMLSDAEAYEHGVSYNEIGKLGAVLFINPYGGQNVTLNAQGETQGDLALTWKPAQVKRLEMPYWAMRSNALHLFTDETGNPIRNAQVFAYCELVSEEDQTLVLKMYGGEPIRIWLNGENIEIKNRPNRRWADMGKVDIPLVKGNNRLRVRVDNARGDELLSMRLVDENNPPVKNVQVQIRSIEDYPKFPQQVYPRQDWNALIAEIPPLAKSEHEPHCGANLRRTMTLLETGGQTKRPVRIFFYGQSITTSRWTFFLIRRLRERYPDTEIISENRARSGWGMDKLNRPIQHDIPRARPDLIVLHAYTQDAQHWEQILQQIRRETTADIMIRTGHVAGRDMKPYNEKGMPILWRDGEWKARDEKDNDEDVLNPIPEDDPISLAIRRLAHKYGCELVECRKEWLAYIRTHGRMHRLDLLSDGLHLNRGGCILMAQMYERHFIRSSISEPGVKTLRRYDAIRSVADLRNDEIELIGDGWERPSNADFTTSTGREDMLKLKFHGNRVDLVMPPCAGKAMVLIDGKTPSELNLLHGTFPGARGLVPAYLMTYHMGDNAIEEEWTLDFTHVSGDYRK